MERKIEGSSGPLCPDEYAREQYEAATIAYCEALESSCASRAYDQRMITPGDSISTSQAGVVTGSPGWHLAAGQNPIVGTSRCATSGLVMSRALLFPYDPRNTT
jgi:hypothetical protein